jgi:hypothetical protein
MQVIQSVTASFALLEKTRGAVIHVVSHVTHATHFGAFVFTTRAASPASARQEPRGKHRSSNAVTDNLM